MIGPAVRFSPKVFKGCSVAVVGLIARPPNTAGHDKGDAAVAAFPALSRVEQIPNVRVGAHAAVSALRERPRFTLAYMSGRMISGDRPVILATSKSRTEGTFFHCETAPGVTFSALAKAETFILSLTASMPVRAMLQINPVSSTPQQCIVSLTGRQATLSWIAQP